MLTNTIMQLWNFWACFLWRCIDGCDHAVLEMISGTPRIWAGLQYLTRFFPFSAVFSPALLHPTVSAIYGPKQMIQMKCECCRRERSVQKTWHNCNLKSDWFAQSPNVFEQTSSNIQTSSNLWQSLRHSTDAVPMKKLQYLWQSGSEAACKRITCRMVSVSVVTGTASSKTPICHIHGLDSDNACAAVSCPATAF